jgi:hypothetical protein
MATATAPATSGATQGMTASGAAGAMGAISSVGDVFSSIISANQAKRAGEFNQQMIEIQAKIYKTSADFEIKQMRAKSDELFKTQEATYVKSGVTFEGSPAEVMMKSYAQREVDALVVKWNADYMTGQANLQGRMAYLEGKTEANKQYASIPATLINAGTKAYKDNPDWFAKKDTK